MSTNTLQKRFLQLILFLLSQCCFKLQAQELKLASVLQDNMVVQQNKAFKVWGTANPGATINVTTSWNKQSVTVIAGADRRFCALVEVPPVEPGDFKKQSLSVASGTDNITIKNLLIGEVWLCSGQSNMQFALNEDLHGKEELATATHPNIRLFSAKLAFNNTPIDSAQGQWTECSQQTLGPFSAVAFYFAKELYAKLNTPIGVIFTGIGASAAQAYVPRQTLAADPLLDSVYLQPYLRSDKSREKVTQDISFEKVMRPYLLYNTMIHPFKNLSIRGFCWYQGESNHLERSSYTHLTQTMIKSWRKVFAQGDLPFYYVQIAPFFQDKDTPLQTMDAFFREAQEKVSELNNTAMVVTMDVGEAKDIHPKNKKPVGLRLAYSALNRTYGLLHVPYEGPHYKHVTYQENQAIVHYKITTVTGGLRTNDNKAPNYFYLAGRDRIFHPAQARISGQTIVLSSSKVPRPVAVRYAFLNAPITNLENGAKIPAVPFRTDNWPE